MKIPLYRIQFHKQHNKCNIGSINKQYKGKAINNKEHILMKIDFNYGKTENIMMKTKL